MARMLSCCRLLAFNGTASGSSREVIQAPFLTKALEQHTHRVGALRGANMQHDELLGYILSGVHSDVCETGHRLVPDIFLEHLRHGGALFGRLFVQALSLTAFW